MRTFFVVAALCLAAAQANIVENVGACVKDLVKDAAKERQGQILEIVDKLRQARNAEVAPLADELVKLAGNLRTQIHEALEGVRDKVKECANAGFRGAFSCIRDLAREIRGDLKPKIQDAANQLKDFVKQHATEFRKVAQKEAGQLENIGRDMVSEITKNARNCLPF